jgi:hypothetical protein
MAATAIATPVRASVVVTTALIRHRSLLRPRIFAAPAVDLD